MSWEKLFGDIGQALGAGAWTEPFGKGASPGEGQFARQLGGVTLRQFVSGSLGGSTEKLLRLEPDTRFVYREVSQYDGGVVHSDPLYGSWSAEGDFPSGTLTLAWTGDAPSNHSIEYQGGDTCRIDGIPTQIL